ncbi:uncharacterized protein A4U43_C08F22690 [Asparagus officinalis]|nr:uncharacterized protein A4U43_C08F22690 [Asparagus officinalis]
MARAILVGEESGRRISRGGGGGFFSYKKITIAVCSLNLIIAIFVFRSLYISAVNRPAPFPAVKYTKDQIRRIEEARPSLWSWRIWADTFEKLRVERLKEELTREKRRWELSDSVKQEMGSEILGRLRGLNETEHRGAVEQWRIQKLEEIKGSNTLENLTSDANNPVQQAEMLRRALEFDWLKLLEEIGFWMPANVNNTEIDDKPENTKELDMEEIIPGRPMPPECHAELHTDYDGAAVRWGLTHHKESAADCCQACLDQAKNAKPGEKKCNIWVYCPSEYGCYSPDIYEHKHQECWLKQADKPRLNFKEKYSEWYRNAHPTAPIIVPWMSGVISA